MLKLLPTLLFVLILSSSAFGQSRYRLTGYVRNNQTDAPIAGASVLVVDVGLGAVTDSVEFFSVPLDGQHQ